MPINPLKYELQNLLSGKSLTSESYLIQAITRYLGTGSSSGPMAEGSQQDKHKEAEKLRLYVDENDLWVKEIDFTDFISAGAEQRVFIKDIQHVYKE